MKELLGVFEEMTELVGVALDDKGEDEVLGRLAHPAEVVGDGEEALELGEVLHPNHLDGWPELELLLTVNQFHLDQEVQLMIYVY